VILDTNGLSAVAGGEAALEPILRKAVQLAIPFIVLGEYRYGIRSLAAVCSTNDGWLNTCGSFESWTLMN